MTILILEDDPMIANINKRFTEKIEGIDEIFLAHTIDEGKTIFQSIHIDILLLDVYLHGETGPDFLSWIRQNNFSTEVIFITADKSSHTVEQALHQGALDYLVKPFTFERFKEALSLGIERALRLNKKTAYDQRTIDQFFQPKEGHDITQNQMSKEIQLDKGLSERSYQSIFEVVQLYETTFTADDMAERVGMARVTIRRYLDFMVRENKLTVDLQYGKRGRPLHYYSYKGSAK